MPSLRQRIQNFMNRGRTPAERPEYEQFLSENATGYRNRIQVLNEYGTVSGLPQAINYSQLTRGDIERALTVYGRAGRPRLSFIMLGRKVNRTSRFRVSTPAFPIIDQAMINRLGQLNEEPNSFGSVLASMNWTFYMNDMLMYGGIANRTIFRLASRREMDVLWDPGKPYATLFARELAGLFLAEYELSQLPGGGEVMYPPRRTISFSLQEYLETLPYFLTRESVNAMTRPDLVGMLFIRGTNQIVPFTNRLYDV